MSRYSGKSRSTRGKRGKQPAGRVLISAATAKRVSLTCAWLAAFGGVAWGLYALDPVAAQAYADVDDYPARVEWVNPPPWLKTDIYAEQPYGSVLEQLTDRVQLKRNANAHAASLCQYVYQQAAASPWISRIDRVTKRADNVAQIYAEYRRPCTYVLHRDTAYLVDPNGVVLAPPLKAAYLSPQQLQDAIPIVGVRKPPPPTGNHWSGNDLQAGLTLARYLADAHRAGQLPLRSLMTTIDVSGFQELAAGPLRIQTAGDTVILWGKTPGREYESEADAEVKLAHLMSLYNELKGLPADRPIVDIRDTDRILLRD